MSKYIRRLHWRVRFLSGQGNAYALRHLEFRLFEGAEQNFSCGSVENCRAVTEEVLSYNSQAAGTRATDLFLYSSSEFDDGWASETFAELPDDIFIARRYPSAGRAVGFVALMAAVQGPATTRISSFIVEASEDGLAWEEIKTFNTNPVWESGETRLFALPNADSRLPVFSFRPNWQEPMVERVSFLTDVMRAAEGAEQRRSVRQTPRRSFEGDYLLTGPERTFWDLFINALGSIEVVAPLYWEVATLKAAVNPGSGLRINFDTSETEWTYHGGWLALLAGATALDYEVVHVLSVDPLGVNLAEPVKRPWPVGTKLLPLRRCVLDQISDLDHRSAGVAVVSTQLRVVGPNYWNPAADGSPIYEGLPALLEEPNWVAGLSTAPGRELTLLDTEIGLTYQTNQLGRALSGQAHRWFLTGRQKLAGFRDLIYRHRGRAGSFWLPTFKADFKLAAPATAAATQITVQNVGYAYTGGPTSGREHIAIKHAGGTILRKILSVVPGTTAATERLNLDGPVGLALSEGQVRRISFVETARFDSDEFEITHYGGVDAHHDAASTFRAFKNTRTSPTPIHFPIALTPINDGPCGITTGEFGVVSLSAFFPLLWNGTEGYPQPGQFYPKTLTMGPYSVSVDIVARSFLDADDQFFLNGNAGAISHPNGAVLASLLPGQVFTMQVRNNQQSACGASGNLQAVITG